MCMSTPPPSSSPEVVGDRKWTWERAEVGGHVEHPDDRNGEPQRK